MAAAAAATTLERLEALACPAVALLVPLEPAEALRLLCTPSARRLALLEWVCSRVHPPLAARLDALQDGPKDARLRELAKLGAELMLCRADDVALVEAQRPAPHRPLPARGVGDPRGGGSPEPPGPPSAPRLRRRRQPPAHSPELGGPPGPAPPVLPALGVAGRDLAALATAFGATELRDPWGPLGSGEPPVLAPCGPLAPPVWRGLRQLVQSLEAVDQLGDTAAEVTRLAGGPAPGNGDAGGHPAAALRGRPQGWGAPPGLTPPPLHPIRAPGFVAPRGGGGPNKWIKEVEDDVNCY
ncbi:HAUS augmin-like complex subunit 7 [Ciconia boyciana]|uniref:HAUS augmin-like complex subunit 7 n=1 Tax=Ciconia boyciana TaxID=52775 RepID=UPI003B9F44AA